MMQLKKKRHVKSATQLMQLKKKLHVKSATQPMQLKKKRHEKSAMKLMQLKKKLHEKSAMKLMQLKKKMHVKSATQLKKKRHVKSAMKLRRSVLVERGMPLVLTWRGSLDPEKPMRKNVTILLPAPPAPHTVPLAPHTVPPAPHTALPAPPAPHTGHPPAPPVLWNHPPTPPTFWPTHRGRGESHHKRPSFHSSLSLRNNTPGTIRRRRRTVFRPAPRYLPAQPPNPPRGILTFVMHYVETNAILLPGRIPDKTTCMRIVILTLVNRLA